MRGGFTLVELLVVLSIIAILAGLVLAVLGAVRERGQSARCISNLRQLAAANMAYAADNQGSFAPAQEPGNKVRWHGARDGSNGAFDPTKGFLAPYLGRQGRVKECPALKDVLTGGQSFEVGTGGYGYNASYVGGSPHLPFNDPARFDARKLIQIQNPARTVMFTDTALPRGEGLQEYAYTEPFYFVGPGGKLMGQANPSTHFRHNGRAHVAWCDGHVTAEEPSKISGSNIYGGNNEEHQVGWFGPEEENGFWNPNSPAANGADFADPTR
jgi:prepilin-type N-terminal cleavage/methylation domain-containing protein/prepilin-type processing-associated H-X9-DG protein